MPVRSASSVPTGRGGAAPPRLQADDLPDGVLAAVLAKLPAPALARGPAQVSRRWRALAAPMTAARQLPEIVRAQAGARAVAWPQVLGRQLDAGALRQVTHLDLRGVPLGDARGAPLLGCLASSCPQLAFLDVSRTGLQRCLLPRPAPPPPPPPLWGRRLEILNLAENALSYPVVLPASLRAVNLSFTGLRDADLRQQPWPPPISTLVLGANALTRAGLARLPPALAVLDVRCNRGLLLSPADTPARLGTPGLALLRYGGTDTEAAGLDRGVAAVAGPLSRIDAAADRLLVRETPTSLRFSRDGVRWLHLAETGAMALMTGALTLGLGHVPGLAAVGHELWSGLPFSVVFYYLLVVRNPNRETMVASRWAEDVAAAYGASGVTHGAPWYRDAAAATPPARPLLGASLVAGACNSLIYLFSVHLPLTLGMQVTWALLPAAPLLVYVAAFALAVAASRALQSALPRLIEPTFRRLALIAAYGRTAPFEAVATQAVPVPA